LTANGVTNDPAPRARPYSSNETRMKEKQAQALRDAWGDRPCAHPAFAREYDQAGERTGNYFCTQCGATVSFRERSELLARRRGGGAEGDAG